MPIGNHSLALIILVVSEKKAFEHFPIGSNVNLCPAVVAILEYLTLNPMGKMFQNASSLKPLGQLKPNCPGMIIGRSSVFYADRKFKMAATTGYFFFFFKLSPAVAAILNFISEQKT
jgi:hypothetical protein